MGIPKSSGSTERAGKEGFPCRVATFITARMGSTRLPGKHMLPVQGRPIIEYLISRVKRAKEPGCVVLCTTTLREDDVLEEIAWRCGIPSFRGHPTDILLRWLKAAREYQVEFIVSAEADDVFTDPECIDLIVRDYRRTGADYITCRGLPFGGTPTGIRVGALQKVCDMKREEDTEGQERFFTKTGLFRVEYIDVTDPGLRHPEIRMTLDYQEDYEFFREVITRMEKGASAPLREIIAFLLRHPEIIEINQGMQKIYEKRYKTKYGSIPSIGTGYKKGG